MDAGGDAGGDGSPDAGDASPADAASGFCASQASSQLFCEDFDQGVPGQFAMTTYGGGAIAADVSDFASPPESLWANTPALAAAGASAGAFATASFSTAGAGRLRLQAALQVDAGCVANRDGVELVQLVSMTGSYAVTLQSSATETDLIEQSFGRDGGIAQFVSHRVSGPWPSTGWNVLVVDVDLTAAKVTVEVSGMTKIDAESLSLLPPSLGAVSIDLGAATENVLAISNGCTVHVDDVLFDAVPQAGGDP